MIGRPSAPVARSRPTAGCPLAEAWYAGLANLSPVTMQAYRDRLDRQILPGLASSGSAS